jgi:hypothetical protein
MCGAIAGLVIAINVAFAWSSESDSVALLQATVQQQISKTSTDSDNDVDQYELTGSSKCTMEKQHASAACRRCAQDAISSTLSSSSAEPDVVLGDAPCVESSTSHDVAGAGALKMVLQLMIILLIADGMRRWKSQKKQRAPITEGPRGQTLLDHLEVVSGSAWVDMVNAAACADVNHFEMALKHKPRMTQVDAWGCTPLHFAAVGGSRIIATQVLQQKADVDARDASDETPLHFAARSNHESICEMLLDAGAEIDAVNVQGMTPLVVAGHANAKESCRLLLDRGAGCAGLADEDLPPVLVSQLVQRVFAATS